ncbi:MAG: aspartate-semialdehyde dehydrogenase [Saprospiraceae bacterium]|nr:aspartate-semialdehyde dehydrogenase [Saprospiraceae bacterium]
MKLAVVGITGLVGSVILEVLEETGFQYDEFLPVASARSVGKLITLNGVSHKVIGMEEAVQRKPDIAIFSAGGGTSLEWAPKFAEVGTTVIDNSSAWRMDPTKKLVVPEINAHQLEESDKIIANPNCSTIQMVAALAPLHSEYGIKRLVVSTYQSFTGTGVKAVKQYQEEKEGTSASDPAYHYPIFENCIPHCDVFYDNGYTREELKLVNETRKILGDNNIKITATAVRVPVNGGHSESVNVEFHRPYEMKNLVALLEKTEGVEVQDEPGANIYPMPLFAKNKNEVFVGRLRRDDSVENGLNMWIVADNLRKGAATNAIQIAQYIVDKKLQADTISA